MRTYKVIHLVQDLIILSISIGFAVLVVKTHAVEALLARTQDFEYIGSFIAGLFFTSIFTTAPAIVALGEISQTASLPQVAFFGAIGAVIGDVVLFTFIRDRFSDHLMELLAHKKEKRKIKIFHHLGLFKWFSFFMGGLIIASPLPDELGIGLLGFSKVNMKLFIPISFIFNFAGIVLIGLVANSI